MTHYNDFAIQRIWSSGYDSLNTCSKIFVLIIFIFFRNPHISTIDLWPPTGYPQVHWHLNRFGKCQLCSVVAIASWSGSFGPEKSRVKSWTSSIFHKRCKITSYYSAVCVCLCVCVCGFGCLCSCVCDDDDGAVGPSRIVLITKKCHQPSAFAGRGLRVLLAGWFLDSCNIHACLHIQNIYIWIYMYVYSIHICRQLLSRTRICCYCRLAKCN